ncbi:MAG: hypothetical protein ACRDTG_28730 [Pseudonocardiaceae bacterium]
MNEHNKKWEKTIAWVGAACALTGVPVAIISGRPLSTILFLVLVIILAPAVCWKVLIKPDWSRATTAKIMLFIVLSSIIPLLLTVILVVSPLRKGFIYYGLGSTEVNQTAITQVATGYTSESYRFTISIRNTYPIEHVVTRVAVDIQWTNAGACCCPPSSEYALSDRVRITQRTDGGFIFSGGVEVAKEEFIPYEGEVYTNNCNLDHYFAIFEPAISLASSEVTEIAIEIPRTLVPEEELVNGEPVAQPEPYTISLPIDNPTDEYNDEYFGLDDGHIAVQTLTTGGEAIYCRDLGSIRKRVATDLDTDCAELVKRAYEFFQRR